VSQDVSCYCRIFVCRTGCAVDLIFAEELSACCSRRIPPLLTLLCNTIQLASCMLRCCHRFCGVQDGLPQLTYLCLKGLCMMDDDAPALARMTRYSVSDRSVSRSAINHKGMVIRTSTFACQITCLVLRSSAPQQHASPRDQAKRQSSKGLAGTICRSACTKCTANRRL
jgi:hypothetical protein